MVDFFANLLLSDDDVYQRFLSEESSFVEYWIQNAETWTGTPIREHPNCIRELVAFNVRSGFAELDDTDMYSKTISFVRKLK